MTFLYLASVFIVGFSELPRGECLGDLLNLYLPFGLVEAWLGMAAVTVVPFGMLDIEGVDCSLICFCKAIEALVGASGFFFDEGGDDAVTNFFRLEVGWLILGCLKLFERLGDMLPTYCCCCSDGFTIFTPGKISATLGTRGFFDKVDECSILSRSCWAGVGDCELALRLSGTGGGLGFLAGFSFKTGSELLLASMAGCLNLGTGGFFGLDCWEDRSWSMLLCCIVELFLFLPAFFSSLGAYGRLIYIELLFLPSDLL